VLSKCANPSCSNEFHYFGEGKVFEVRANERLLNKAHAKTGKKLKSTEHFWLCSGCASTLTIAMDAERNVIVIPRRQSRVHQAVAS